MLRCKEKEKRGNEMRSKDGNLTNDESFFVPRGGDATKEVAGRLIDTTDCSVSHCHVTYERTRKSTSIKASLREVDQLADRPGRAVFGCRRHDEYDTEQGQKQKQTGSSRLTR